MTIPHSLPNAPTTHLRTPRRGASALAAGLLAWTAAGCGAGTAGIFATDSSSSSSEPVRIGQLQVLDTKLGTVERPARVVVSFSGPEDKQASAQLRYRVGPGVARDIPGGVVDGRSGESRVFEWAFASELGVEDTLVENVLVWATLPGQQQPEELNSSTVILGNEVPIIEDLEIPLDGDAVRGLVPISFSVRDRGGFGNDVSPEDDGDRVSVFITIQRVDADGQPVGDPFNARPAGSEAPPPGRPSIEGVDALATGTPLVFLWDSSGDLPEQELDVELSIVVSDFQGGLPAGESDPTTRSLRVDNNEEPIAALSPSFVANPDQRRGLPVPVTVTDPESDEVQLVVQWSRELGQFPDLPPAAEIETLLADEAQRKALRIARPWALATGGHTGSADLDSVELPELAQTIPLGFDPDQLPQEQLPGSELQILDPSQLPRPASPALQPDRPSLALPLGAGPMALLLDNPGSAWRIREVDLQTGESRPLTTGNGFGTTMAWSPSGAFLFVAIAEGPQWRVERWNYDPVSGELSDRVTRMPPGNFNAFINGLAPLGEEIALVTVGSFLFRMEFSPAGQVVELMSDLAGAWGLARHPFLPQRIYLAERAADRVRVFDVTTEAGIESYTTIDGLNQPETLAISPDGTELFVVTGAASGLRQLRSIPLGGLGHGESFLLNELQAATWRMAAGEEGRLCLTAEQRNEVFTGGGVIQERTILAYDPQTRRVQVSPPFEEAPEPGSPWRIQRSLTRTPGSPDGQRGIFVWDSREVPGGGDVYLRVTPVDSDTGFAGETDTARLVLPPLQGGQFAMQAFQDSGQGDAESVAVGDFDGDGDLDIVAALFTGRQLSLIHQVEGGYELDSNGAPLITLGAGQLVHPIHVTVADVDENGLVDILCGDLGAINFFDGFVGPGAVRIYRQETPGNFVHGAGDLLGGPGSSFDHPGDQDAVVRWVATGDLDGDGGLDVVTVDRRNSKLDIFYRKAGGYDRDPDLSLSSSDHLGRPASVAIADLNSDGRLDLVAPSEDTNELLVFLADGQGGYPEQIVLGPGLGTTAVPWRVHVADIDGDGRNDIICSNSGSDDVNVWYQNPSGPLPFGQGMPVIEPDEVLQVSGSVSQQAEGLSSADIDGDGRMDLLTANRETDNVRVYHQIRTRQENGTGQGTFVSDPVHHVLGNNLVTGSPRGLVIADMEGDGDPDVVLSTAENRISVFLHVSVSEFAPSSSALGGSGITSNLRSVAHGDLDRDGDLDWVLAAPTTPMLSLVRQESLRSYSLPETLSLPDVPWDVLAQDVNADGRLDLIAALDSVTGGSRLAWFDGLDLAESDASAQIVDLPISGLRGLAATDLDRDGDLEVAAVGEGEIAVWHPESNATQAMVYAQLEGATHLAARDLDRDGWVDLVVTRRIDTGDDDPVQRITLLWNKATGNPLALQLQNLTTPAGAMGTHLDPLTLGDIDGDGLVDLAAISRGEGTFGNLAEAWTVIWFQGEDRAFGSQVLTQHTSGSRPTAVTLLDVDRSGRLDVVVALDRTETGQSSRDVLAVYRQVAPRAFEAAPYPIPDENDTLEFASWIGAVDADGDGDPDLAAINEGTETLTLHYGGF